MPPGATPEPEVDDEPRSEPPGQPPGQPMTLACAGDAASGQLLEAAAWHGQLDLRFESRSGGTRLVRNRHEGPLRLLKALPSEDGRRLEAVIVHPPGGLVGGDCLSLDLHVGAGARVLATTPGAQKWYRAAIQATSATCLTVATGATLEWLPQPAILFDCSRARQSLAVELAGDACCVGWEGLIRGRGAMGETLEAGHIDQTLSISVDQGLLWQERLHAQASDRLFSSPVGWDGNRAAGTVWCCAPAVAPDTLLVLRDRWRSLLGSSGGATIAAAGLLLAKVLSGDSEPLMATCQALWRATRASLEGDGGSLPRIWRT